MTYQGEDTRVADRNDNQLALIDEIGRLLGEATIRFWLRGGWAVDFHLGRLTRQHADIDLVVWFRHRERIRRILTSQGFSEVPGYRPPQLVLEKWGEETSFLFVVRCDGGIVVPGYEAWPFRPGALRRQPTTFRNVSARLISVDELLDEKLRRQESSGKPLRPKDYESLALLKALAASPKDAGGVPAR